MSDIEIEALYFDGQTSQVQKVRLRWNHDGSLQMKSESGERSYPASAVKVEEPLGKAPRILRLSEGAYCTTTDHDGVERALRQINGAHRPWLHRLESSWRIAAACLLVVVLFAGVGFKYIVPVAADRVARTIPEAWLAQMSAGTLPALDQVMFSPTQLSEERQQQLREKFARYFEMAEGGRVYRVEFRSSRTVGANALALPTGEIVFTDGLIELAEDDDEIVAVLAHECGHVHHRHALRTILQGSAAVTLLSLLTGDLASLTGVLASFPDLMIRLSYSRSFEEEADRYAAINLRRASIDPLKLATILERLGDKKEQDGADWTRYLSTHPPTEERRRILEGFRLDPPAPSPAYPKSE